jgi:hypothetical protein
MLCHHFAFSWWVALLINETWAQQQHMAALGASGVKTSGDHGSTNQLNLLQLGDYL